MCRPKADRLARALAQQTGETITEVVIEALREKLLKEQGKRALTELKEALDILDSIIPYGIIPISTLLGEHLCKIFFH
jgi:hypothetical protein